MSDTFASDVLVLAKVRLNTLVVVTTAGGYYMAAVNGVDVPRLIWTCLGTALVAGGASAINQVTERDTDRLMERTKNRPVAHGRVSPRLGSVVAATLAGIGLAVLWTMVNSTPALVSLATLLIYVLAYTPLKRRSSLATIVGAIPGALPPLIGWTAAGGSLSSPAAWTLFLIMFLWQLPHFLAIAWIYRDDYARAGLPMLPVVDKTGAVTGRQAMVWAATLLLFSLMPVLVGLTTMAYGVGALVLGIGLFVWAARFAMQRSLANARALFYASITYLPLLWALMAYTRHTGELTAFTL
jgi:protoheme IX farnesyltransferase